MINAFNRLAKAETSFMFSEFLSPVIIYRPVRVRIEGVIMSILVTPRSFQGWAVLSPVTQNYAKVIRPPTLAERQSYLRLFPAVRLIVCRRWYGVPANQDKRFNIVGLAPIQLAEEVQLFDTVICRFDGQTLWFDSIDEQADGRIAVYLRQELQKLTEPAEIRHSGLTPEIRDAYLMAWGPCAAADMEAKRDKNEERLKAALRRAGADYQSYIERADTFTVEYRVGLELHRSTVRKDTLQVESAGICLNNTDSRFDLQSLVSVISEAQRRHKIVRVGENMTEDWDDE